LRPEIIIILENLPKDKWLLADKKTVYIIPVHIIEIVCSLSRY